MLLPLAPSPLLLMLLMLQLGLYSVQFFMCRHSFGRRQQNVVGCRFNGPIFAYYKPLFPSRNNIISKRTHANNWSEWPYKYVTSLIIIVRAFRAENTPLYKLWMCVCICVFVLHFVHSFIVFFCFCCCLCFCLGFVALHRPLLVILTTAKTIYKITHSLSLGVCVFILILVYFWCHSLHLFLLLFLV